MSDFYLSAAYAGLFPILTGHVPPPRFERKTFTTNGHDGKPFDVPAVSLRDATLWMIETDDDGLRSDINYFFRDFVNGIL